MELFIVNFLTIIYNFYFDNAKVNCLVPQEVQTHHFFGRDQFFLNMNKVMCDKLLGQLLEINLSLRL